MKATIDGITCEGTPEEISEFKKLRDAISHHKLWKDLEKKQGVKVVDSPFTGKVDNSKPYIWESKGSPYDAKFDKTNGGSSWQGVDVVNPDMKCESNEK